MSKFSHHRYKPCNLGKGRKTFLTLTLLNALYVCLFLVLRRRHAQAMAAIKAYSHWLQQLYTESTRINQEKDQFYKIIVTLIDCVSQLTNKQVGQ